MATRTPSLLVTGGSETNVSTAWSAWRTGFFPAIALLGVALPIAFLSWLDRYLYYLRPMELIPTYGTAWLLTAVLAALPSLLCALALQKLATLDRLRWIYHAFTRAIFILTAALIVAALARATLLWLNQRGLLLDFPVGRGIVAFSLIAGVLVTLTHAGNSFLTTIAWIAKAATVLGALSLTSLPFSGWDNGSQTQVSVPAPSDPKPPNVLLVTIDTLSADHMSLYGASRHTSPRLDAFAGAAITFDRAYANSNFTTPGISSILTATRPWSHRALQLPSWPNAQSRGNSLPAILQRDGYLTAYFGTNSFASPAKNGMGTYFESIQGDRAPFFSFCGDRFSTVLPYACPAAELPQFIFAARLWNITSSWLSGSPNWQFDPRPTIAAALKWLGTRDERKPVFLWIHFFPPHDPYAAPAPWLGEFDSSPGARDAADSEPRVAFLSRSVPTEEVHTLEARYDESIKYVDYYVGEFLAQATQQLGSNTVIIVTADHGESFDHGYGAHTGPALYESLIHIPLIIKLPFQTRGLRASNAVEQVDIAPTLTELVGLTPPAAWEGRPIAEVSGTDKPVFTMNFEENQRDAALTTGSVAVIDGRWKLVQYLGRLHYPKMPELHDSLYDLVSDPGEKTNQIALQPEEAEHLRKLIATELRRHGAATR